MKRKIRRLAILVSGNGTTLQAIIDAISCNILDCNIAVVVSDNAECFALKRAQKSEISTYVLKAKTFKERDTELNEILKKYQIELVVLAGYLKLIGKNVLDDFTVINTHPSLLPKYGGKGMHGMNVHKAVINNNEKESGVTVHFVSEEYDKGQIIRQTCVPVYPDDNADDLAIRVQVAEKTQLISCLKDFSEGKIDISKSF